MGENEQCTGNQDEESCVTESGGDFCQHASNGVCSGDAGCEDRNWLHECEKEKHQGEHHDSGPFCEMNDVYREHEFQHVDCSGRTLSNMCVENNMHVGQGDGCGDGEVVDGTWVKKFTDENSCTSYRAGDRNADDSFDGYVYKRTGPPPDKGNGHTPSVVPSFTNSYSLSRSLSPSPSLFSLSLSLSLSFSLSLCFFFSLSLSLSLLCERYADVRTVHVAQF